MATLADINATLLLQTDAMQLQTQALDNAVVALKDVKERIADLVDFQKNAERQNRRDRLQQMEDRRETLARKPDAGPSGFVAGIKQGSGIGWFADFMSNFFGNLFGAGGSFVGKLTGAIGAGFGKFIRWGLIGAAIATFFGDEIMAAVNALEDWTGIDLSQLIEDNLLLVTIAGGLLVETVAKSLAKWISRGIKTIASIFGKKIARMFGRLPDVDLEQPKAQKPAPADKAQKPAPADKAQKPAPADKAQKPGTTATPDKAQKPGTTATPDKVQKTPQSSVGGRTRVPQPRDTLGRFVKKKSKGEIAQIVAKNIAKKTAGSLIKKIPLIGLATGLFFAADRALAGDFTGAGLEVTSGAAGIIPIVGTGTGVGVDIALLARDIYKETYGEFPKIPYDEQTAANMKEITTIVSDQIVQLTGIGATQIKPAAAPNRAEAYKKAMGSSLPEVGMPSAGSGPIAPSTDAMGNIIDQSSNFQEDYNIYGQTPAPLPNSTPAKPANPAPLPSTSGATLGAASMGARATYLLNNSPTINNITNNNGGGSSTSIMTVPVGTVDVSDRRDTIRRYGR